MASSRFSAARRRRRAEHRVLRFQLSRGAAFAWVCAVLSSHAGAYVAGRWVGRSGGLVGHSRGPVSEASPKARSHGPGVTGPQGSPSAEGLFRSARDADPARPLDGSEGASAPATESPSKAAAVPPESGPLGPDDGATKADTPEADVEQAVSGEAERPERSARPSPLDAEPPRGAWGLQLGAFETRKEAVQLLEALDDVNLPRFVTPVDLGRRGLWHRVRVGAFRSKRRALGARRRLGPRVPDDPLLIRYE